MCVLECVYELHTAMRIFSSCVRRGIGATREIRVRFPADAMFGFEFCIFGRILAVVAAQTGVCRPLYSFPAPIRIVTSHAQPLLKMEDKQPIIILWFLGGVRSVNYTGPFLVCVLIMQWYNALFKKVVWLCETIDMARLNSETLYTMYQRNDLTQESNPAGLM